MPRHLRTPRRRRFLLAAALAGALAAAGCDAAPGATPAERWLDVSRGIAGPWPAMQRANGSFPDYLEATRRGFRSLYGDAMLGYGLLQNGLRDGDRTRVDAGLRGITHGVRDPGPAGAKQNPFEDLAVANAYLLASDKLAGDAGFAAVRGEWEDYLRRTRVTQINSKRRYYNYFLVEATLIVDLLRTGLTSAVPGAVLSDPQGSKATALKLLNGGLTKAARPYSRANPSVGTLTVLPDPPRNPLAYHALQLGLLAHSVEALGPEASPAARKVLRRAADASWALAGPDGDLSYFGRSQEQSWTLPITAYGAEVAASLADTQAAAAARYRALARRALDRLQAAYGPGAGRYGLFLTPALRQSATKGLRGLDSYVGAVDYTGLTLVTSNWALDREDGRAAGALGGDTEGSFRLEKTPATFATVRRGDVWFAVRERPTGVGDIRYDFGLVALKVRSGDGSWRDVLRLRPKTPSKGRLDSAGPVLLGGGRRGYPYGRGLGVSGGGVVTMKVDFRDSRGRTLRRGVAVRFEPIGCGVRMSVASPGRFEYSVFSRGSKLRIGSRAVTDADQSVGFGRSIRARVESGYGSDLDASLKRVRAIVAGPLAVRICAPR